MIEVKGLSVSYSKQIVLDDISFKYEEAKIVGILGPNGAGKSTLIKAILNLVPMQKGTVIWDQEILSDKEVSYLAQRNDVDWDFPLSVIDLVLMGLYPKVGIAKRIKKKHIKEAELILESVGMIKEKEKQISQLSRGQQQRVFMARALIQKPKILFLDEPFVGIDLPTETLLMRILCELKHKGVLIFIVHHDLSKVESYFDEVILLNKKVHAMGAVLKIYNQDNLNLTYDFDNKGASLWNSSLI